MSKTHKERLGAKFENSTAQTLKNFCKARGENYSSFIRKAVKKELARYSYFSDEEKKALGMNVDESKKED